MLKENCNLPHQQEIVVLLCLHTDWIVIPCNEQIFGLLICQKELNETKLGTNGAFLSKLSIKTCQQSSFPFESKCILFKKYTLFTNFSTLQDGNDNENIMEFNIFEIKNINILKEYFTYIQHFYSKPIQFTHSVYLTDKYLSYRSLYTQYFLKLK